MMKSVKIACLCVYTLLIGYVSLASDSSPDSIVPDLNSFGIDNLDKIAHIGAYFIYPYIAVSAFSLISRKSVIITCSIILVYGLVLEELQHFVPLREPSVFDFLANAVGVLCGGYFIYQLNHVYSRTYLARWLNRWQRL